ncbi:predicted protein [Postia placenta Mad-698-R]|nr:predicted protein [Postia placenta Mad-698-R]
MSKASIDNELRLRGEISQYMYGKHKAISWALQRLSFNICCPRDLSFDLLSLDQCKLDSMAFRTPVDKEVLKLLLPLRYDGKTIIECNRFLSQLRIYWQVNMALTTIKLKVQVALSLPDGNARTWATPLFTQLASVQVGVQGVTTPFANKVAFATAFKACFGNLDDATAAQVELAKLCADKSMHERRTTTEFSALFKGLADCSKYGDLELRDKYLSGIPSRVY